VAELEQTALQCPSPTLVVPADLCGPAGTERVFDAVTAAFGAVEIFVANAGAATSAPIHKVSDEQWQLMLDLNLTAPFHGIRRAVPSMLAAGYGRIVVVASVAAKVGEPYVAAYTAAKHGVLGLVRSAAAELARTGVTVNAVCPGYVDTPMTDSTVAAIAQKTQRSAEQARDILARKQPIGRLIAAAEVAEAVWFCVQNAAVTGQALNVDGGAVQS
jgi:NAD(P)-dependent dehydrogenase (short-subunit alcohol dehydrogenase family)